MAVILPAQHIVIVIVLQAARIGAVHVDSGHAELERFRRRLQDAAAPVIRAFHLLVRRPAFLDLDLDQASQIPIERALPAACLVEPSDPSWRRVVISLTSGKNGMLRWINSSCCAACHMSSGAGVPTLFPRLAQAPARPAH